MRGLYVSVLALVVGLAVLMPRTGGAQEIRRQLIVGTVRDSAGAAVTSGEVLVTAARTFSVTRGLIEGSGRFRVAVDSGTGDYLVVVTVTGFRSERQRATPGMSRDSVILEIVMTRAPQALTTVAIKSSRPAVRDLNRELGARGGASEQLASEGLGALGAADAGDLAASALLNSSFSSTANGVGAMGLGGEQTRITINGLPSPISSMPRDMRRRVRVGTTNYDPSFGGFSGASIEVDLRAGSTLNNPRARLSRDGQANSLFTPASQLPGGPRTVASFTNSGEAREDAVYYNLGASITHRATQQLLFGSQSPRVLEANGISAETAARTLGRLDRAGVPTDPRSQQVRSSGSADVLGRIDWMKTRFGPLALTASAGLSRPEPSTSSLENGTRQTRAGRSNATLQLSSSNVLKSGWRTEWRMGAVVSASSDRPLLGGPAVTLWMPSDSSSDLLGAFGGSGLSQDISRRLTFAGGFEMEGIMRLPGVGRHQIKAFMQHQSDLSMQRSLASSGTYLFGSLDDLEARSPLSFIRTVDDVTRRASAGNMAFGVGDAWRINRFLLLQIGLRADLGGSFTAARPSLELQKSLRLPRSLSGSAFQPLLSPRVGFSWSYRKERVSGASTTSSQSFGTLAFPGNGTLRGGVGLFRSYWNVDELLTATALTDGARRRVLFCNTGLVPAFTWYSTASQAPSACSDGSSANAARTSGVFLPASAAPPAAWRGNLTLSHPLSKRLTVEVEAVSSYAFNQRTSIDRNLPAAFASILHSEANRASYRDAASIDPATGLATTNLARPLSAYGQVLELGTAGRVRTSELTASLLPESWRSIWIRVATTVRRSDRFGTDYNATGVRTGTQEWMPTPNLARSRTVIELNRWGRRIGMGGLLTFESGARFTPLVAGDVNGDGNSRNDRAFVGAGLLADPAFASFDRDARRCLSSQRESIAGVASCTAPNRLRLDLSASLAPNPSAMVRRGAGRATYTFRLVNAPALLDELFNRSPRGWGGSGYVDPIVASVRSFDPVSQQFGYVLNRNFGRPGLSGTTRRAPYLLSFDAQWFLGKSVADQEAIKTLKRSRVGDERASATAITARIRTTFHDPYQEILEAGDSLLLQRNQVEEILRQQAILTARVDSVWQRFADRAVDREKGLNEREAGELLQKTYSEVLRLLRVGVEPLKTFLVAAQLKRVPGNVAALLAGQDPLFYLR